MVSRPGPSARMWDAVFAAEQPVHGSTSRRDVRSMCAVTAPRAGRTDTTLPALTPVEWVTDEDVGAGLPPLPSGWLSSYQVHALSARRPANSTARSRTFIRRMMPRVGSRRARSGKRQGAAPAGSDGKAGYTPVCEILCRTSSRCQRACPSRRSTRKMTSGAVPIQFQGLGSNCRSETRAAATTTQTHQRRWLPMA
jgi:hypothetical protein